MMLTAMAFVRIPRYHRSSDVAETSNQALMTRVTEGLFGAFKCLANECYLGRVTHGGTLSVISFLDPISDVVLRNRRK